MENATNSHKFACCSAVRMPQPPQATVDLGLELGNKRFVSPEMAWGERRFFEFTINYYQLLSLGGSGSFSQTSQLWRTSCCMSRHAMLCRGAPGRGVAGSGKSTEFYH